MSVFPPNTSVEATIKADPRIRLWQQLTERIGDRVWQGYGFGRRIQAEEIANDLADLQLTHAHNLFASQWLQTGAVGLACLSRCLLPSPPRSCGMSAPATMCSRSSASLGCAC